MAVDVDVDAMVTALCTEAESVASSSTALLHLARDGTTGSSFPPGVRAPPPTALGLGLGPPTMTPLLSPAPILQPTWDVIATDRRGTILHIPRGAVQAVSATYITLLSRYHEERSWESFHALWAFPKAVLAPLGRSGRAHSGVLGRKVVARATAYLLRPVSESWAESALPDVQPTRRTRGRAAREYAPSVAVSGQWGFGEGIEFAHLGRGAGLLGSFYSCHVDSFAPARNGSRVRTWRGEGAPFR